jgi:hypothetical protein
MNIMTTEKKTMQQYIEMLRNEILSAEQKRSTIEPEKLAEMDKYIRKLKRHIQIVEESFEPQDVEKKEASDDITEAKLCLSEIYNAALADGVDFNDTSNYMLISGRRLEDSIERLDVLGDLLDDERILQFPDWDEYMQPLYKCVDEKQKEKDKIVARVLQTEKEIETLESQLQEVKQSKDIEAIVLFSDQLEEAKSKRKYMLPLIEEVENSDTFPDGEIAKAWEKVWSIYGHEWRNRLETIRRAAQLYHKSIQELKELDDQLRMIRLNIQSFGKNNGSKEEIIEYRPVIAKDVTADSLNLMGRDENSVLKNMIFFPIEKML